MSEVQDHAALAAIIIRIQQGDERAPGELVDAVQAKLFKFCILLCRNREVAEDLCQEALVKSLRNLQNLKNPETYWAWLYQITRNLFIDQKRKPEEREEFLEMQEFDSKADFDLVLSVQKVLSQFEPEDRMLLLLVELEGCSYKEASEVLHISEDAVRSRLHRLKSAFVKKYNSSETK